MKLEEAKSYLRTVIKVNNDIVKEARKNGDINVIELTADLDTQSIAIATVLKELETKNEIINLMALAILNYDDQLVINKYRDLEDVKNHFQELSKED